MDLAKQFLKDGTETFASSRFPPYNSDYWDCDYWTTDKHCSCGTLKDQHNHDCEISIDYYNWLDRTLVESEERNILDAPIKNK